MKRYLIESFQKQATGISLHFLMHFWAHSIQKFLVIASSSSEIHAACNRPLHKLRKFRTLSTLQFFERPGMCWITQLLQYDSKVLLSLYYPRPSWAHTEFTAGIGMSCEMGFGSTNHVMGVPPYTNLDSWNMQKVLALRKVVVLIPIVSHTNTYTISNTFFCEGPFLGVRVWWGGNSYRVHIFQLRRKNVQLSRWAAKAIKHWDPNRWSQNGTTFFVNYYLEQILHISHFALFELSLHNVHTIGKSTSLI